MPLRDIRTQVGTTKGKRSGHTIVQYRNIDGIFLDAKVLGQGTGSGLKLEVFSFGGASKIIDNVAAATGMKQTNVYHERF